MPSSKRWHCALKPHTFSDTIEIGIGGCKGRRDALKSELL